MERIMIIDAVAVSLGIALYATPVRGLIDRLFDSTVKFFGTLLLGCFLGSLFSLPFENTPTAIPYSMAIGLVLGYLTINTCLVKRFFSWLYHLIPADARKIIETVLKVAGIVLACGVAVFILSNVIKLI